MHTLVHVVNKMHKGKGSNASAPYRKNDIELYVHEIHDLFIKVIVQQLLHIVRSVMWGIIMMLKGF